MKEFHVKEPLYIFLYGIKDMSEFGKSVKLSRFINYTFSKIMYIQHFTPFNHCSGVELTIFSGVGHVCRYFLNFIFKNISCNNNLVGCGKLIFTSPLTHI